MSDEAGFLAAIRAKPDDDALRLVYADWLEERADPRAEFVRLDTMLSKEVHSPNSEAQSRLKQLRLHLDREWMLAIGRAGCGQITVLKLVYNLEISPDTRSLTLLPNWHQVEAAIRQMDRSHFPPPGIHLQTGEGSTSFFVVGRPDVFAVAATIDGVPWLYSDPTETLQGPIMLLLHPDGVHVIMARCLPATNIETVLRSAKYFHYFGELLPESWSRETIQW